MSIQSRTVTLFFAPERVNVEGTIVTLTPQMADSGIRDAWWVHEDLKKHFDPPAPIDRQWNWNELGIEFEGTYLTSEKVALVAGEGDAVQGAMMVSSDPVPSFLNPGEQGLFVELLFTAPWNRPNLRADGKPYVLGVGSELITWAAWFSRQKGYKGRLRLDSSPDHIGWYQNRGLQILGLKPIVYENVEYMPMELLPAAAERLLVKWEAD